jgi:hypothetical protein
MQLPKAHKYSLLQNGGSPITPIDMLLGITKKPKNNLIGRCVYTSDTTGERKQVHIGNLVVKPERTVRPKPGLSKKRLFSASLRVKEGEDIKTVARMYRVTQKYLEDHVKGYTK